MASKSRIENKCFLIRKLDAAYTRRRWGLIEVHVKVLFSQWISSEGRRYITTAPFSTSIKSGVIH